MDMDPRFHAAQAALADGDVGRLTTLIAADPELAHVWGDRTARAT
jgi:hypothetical protein